MVRGEQLYPGEEMIFPCTFSRDQCNKAFGFDMETYIFVHLIFLLLHPRIEIYIDVYPYTIYHA